MRRRTGRQTFFVSYSRSHPEVARLLYDVLVYRGDRVLIDSRDVEPGDQWLPKLRALIDHSDAILLVWCCHARDSAWVRAEIAYASGTKPIQPAVICPCPLPGAAAGTQWIDGRVPGHECTASCSGPTPDASEWAAFQVTTGPAEGPVPRDALPSSPRLTWFPTMAAACAFGGAAAAWSIGATSAYTLLLLVGIATGLITVPRLLLRRRIAAALRGAPASVAIPARSLLSDVSAPAPVLTDVLERVIMGDTSSGASGGRLIGLFVVGVLAGVAISAGYANMLVEDWRDRYATVSAKADSAEHEAESAKLARAQSEHDLAEARARLAELSDRLPAGPATCTIDRVTLSNGPNEISVNLSGGSRDAAALVLAARVKRPGEGRSWWPATVLSHRDGPQSGTVYVGDTAIVTPVVLRETAPGSGILDTSGRPLQQSGKFEEICAMP